MGPPVIGITGYADRARWDIWDLPATLVPQPYVDAVVGAGGTAVVLPPSGLDVGVVERLDGLVFTAGPDIDPVHYGGEPHPAAELRPGRDEAELALMRAACDVDLPVLGVCRGLQLLAIVYGGALHQHLPDALGHTGHCRRTGKLDHHAVRFAPGSCTAALLGERLVVNSHHHQGVSDPGGLTAVGWSEDGLIEAVEDPARRFVVGVQWHPELENPELFSALVEAASTVAVPS